MDKKERVKQAFLEVHGSDTDWSRPADLFIDWNVRKDFKTESFNNFVEWIESDQLDDLWTFFFGYGDDFDRFAEDWIAEEEKEEYLNLKEES